MLKWVRETELSSRRLVRVSSTCGEADSSRRSSTTEMAWFPSGLDLYTPSSMEMPLGMPLPIVKKSLLMPPTTWYPKLSA